jgi:iron complex transport system substrate-binding protein
MQQTRLVAMLAALALVLAVVPTGVGATAANATQEDCTFPVTVEDATGTEVTVEERPERVVVLGASAAQTLWDIGARDRVVGMPVKPYTAYLEGSEERTDVVNQDGSINQEAVVGLQPDLVLAPSIVPDATVEQLRAAGLTVYKAPFGRSIEDIYAKIDQFGRLVGNCEEATATREEMQARVETVREAVSGEESPRALYYFYNFTAGNGTFISELVTTAGAENVAASAGVEGYQQLNPEIVADRDPQWLIVQADSPMPAGEPYASTTAVRENNTVLVSADLISQPGPRVVVPLTKMAKAFHPEAYAAANATATPTPAATATPVETEATDAKTPGATAGGGPGFGVAGAIAALLGAALVARRWA